ncbi:hypothetical protein RFY44_05950 [Acinetobacter bereziniae]|uniref:hypothetical protein n=1 Tax=Acinetobacter bereziniae TaxID=106648 RepID=UPI001250BC49|nr:hypothetical protein [Acinetobacter bereziniae]MDQ9818423.1 hypothetical protein [Acinetobacter bereziniae]
MQSSDILELSKTLIASADPDDRVYINNIIGRSYYSCFHKISEIANDRYNWAESENVKGGAHAKMISRLDNHNLSEPEKLKLIAKIKNDVITLKKKRINADYFLEIVFTKLEANYCVTTAENIHKAFDLV